MDLTEEQQKFLEALEKEFANRFTEDDEVYWEEHTVPMIDPPILEPWYNKPRRRFDYSKRGRDRDMNGRDRSRDDGSRDRFNSGRFDRNDRYGRIDRYNRHDIRDRHGSDRDRSRSSLRHSEDSRDRRGGGNSGGRNSGRDAWRDREHHRQQHSRGGGGYSHRPDSM